MSHPEFWITPKFGIFYFVRLIITDKTGNHDFGEVRTFVAFQAILTRFRRNRTVQILLVSAISPKSDIFMLFWLQMFGLLRSLLVLLKLYGALQFYTRGT
jgi:hypothetical protein